MRSESIYNLLRQHIQDGAEVNENLLSFVANNSNGQSVLYMSLEQFCGAAGINYSEASAFFHSFGINSFLSFKSLLRECLYSEMTECGMVNRTIASIADEVVRYEMQNLCDFSKSIDCVKMKRLAEDIMNASEVVLFVHDYSSPSAHNMARMLRVLKIEHHISSTKSTEDANRLLNLSDSALVITFGFPRYSKDVLLRLKCLKQKGVRIVSLTDSSESPFAFLSDYYFTIPLRSFDFTDSYSATMVFISILSVWLAMMSREETFPRFQKREQIVDDMNMFLW